MKFLSREEFKKQVPRKEEVVELPEFGEDAAVRVVGFTANERQEFENQFIDSKGRTVPSKMRQYRQLLLLATVRDENDQPLFTPEDVEGISNQSAVVVERIVDAAMRVTGLAANIEDIKKK